MTFDPMGKQMPDPNCRYVCESGSDEWLAKRKQYVTASDVAVLLGENPYQKPESLIEQKLRGDELPDNASMWWGRFMQRPLIDATSIALGLTLHERESMFVRGDLGVSCTLDGVAVPGVDLERADRVAVRGPRTDLKGPNLRDDDLYDKSWYTDLLQTIVAWDQPMLLEVKTTAEFVGRKYTYQDCPGLYNAQVQTQMLVTGIEACLVTCLVGGRDLRCWFVEADADYQARICAAVTEFRGELRRLERELS